AAASRMAGRPSGSVAWLVACAVSAGGVLCCNGMSRGAMSAAAENASITIGAVLALTGDAAHWGLPARDGAQLAAEEINAAGGIGGRKLALTVEDDRSRPADAVAAFNRLAAAGH